MYRFSLRSRPFPFFKNKMAAKTNKPFMEIVRQYPVLYHRFSKDFKDKCKKDNAWSKIAEATGLSEECTKKYKNTDG